MSDPPSTGLIIDTSVAIKWYLSEEGSDEARRFMIAPNDRHAADLLPIEAAHVLLKRTRRRDPAERLSLKEARWVVDTIRGSAPIQFHYGGPLLDPAFALASEIGASIYDGLFLALAVQSGGLLVTADRTL